MSMFDAVEEAPDGAAEQPARRHLSERQAEVMERLLAAAAEEAEERPYAEISVRTIARRAGVAPATAYTYFSGKDHLLAEVLWRRMQSSPGLVDLTLSLPDRVADSVRTMGFGSMGSPAVAVCTEQFEPLAHMLATRDGRGNLAMTVLPFPLETRPESEVRDIARRAYPSLREALGVPAS